MEIVFYFSLVFIIYTYVLYPAAIILLGTLFTKDINNNSSQISLPHVSIIIAVKNEESNIGKRIENLLTQQYPTGKLEIIIVSDGSTDRTNEIVEEFAHSSDTTFPVKLFKYDQNQGKPHAINLGVSKATGEIIAFGDARQQFTPDTIQTLVSNFSDPTIGAVSGELYFKEDFESNIQAQMGAYWKYEKIIRKSESAFSSAVGVTGAIYAIRKELFDPIPDETLIDDVLIPMNIALKGYRVIFENRACAYDVVSKNNNQEHLRKVRTLAGNWQLITLKPELFNPLKNPIFFQFISHKICRILVPFALPPLLISSIFLTENTFVTFCLLAQILVYGLALMGSIIDSLRNNKIIGLCYFFVSMNIAAANGFWLWITGKSKTLWKPAYKVNENNNK